MHTMHDTPQEATDTTTKSSHYHAVVWLDHHEARIVHFSMTAASGNENVVRPADPPQHLHIKAGSAAGTHVTVEPAFFRDVAKQCDEAHAVLLVGPSTAKTEFITYIKKHSPQTAVRIAGVEASAKVTDPQLLALGRAFFSKTDRMTSQT